MVLEAIQPPTVREGLFAGLNLTPEKTQRLTQLLVDVLSGLKELNVSANVSASVVEIIRSLPPQLARGYKDIQVSVVDASGNLINDRGSEMTAYVVCQTIADEINAKGQGVFTAQIVDGQGDYDSHSVIEIIFNPDKVDKVLDHAAQAANHAADLAVEEDGVDGNSAGSVREQILSEDDRPTLPEIPQEEISQEQLLRQLKDATGLEAKIAVLEKMVQAGKKVVRETQSPNGSYHQFEPRDIIADITKIMLYMNAGQLQQAKDLLNWVTSSYGLRSALIDKYADLRDNSSNQYFDPRNNLN